MPKVVPQSGAQSSTPVCPKWCPKFNADVPKVQRPCAQSSTPMCPKFNVDVPKVQRRCAQSSTSMCPKFNVDVPKVQRRCAQSCAQSGAQTGAQRGCMNERNERIGNLDPQSCLSSFHLILRTKSLGTTLGTFFGHRLGRRLK